MAACLLVAHRVISRRCYNSDAFGAEQTFGKPRLCRAKFALGRDMAPKDCPQPAGSSI
jgi:hypothetical protein